MTDSVELELLETSSEELVRTGLRPPNGRRYCLHCRYRYGTRPGWHCEVRGHALCAAINLQANCECWQPCLDLEPAPINKPKPKPKRLRLSPGSFVLGVAAAVATYLIVHFLGG